MKVVILAGGMGTRLSEETSLRPKPMVEIGGRPLLWHIMKHYAHYGFDDFIILSGYKGEVIKEYFAHYHLHHSSIRIELASRKIEVLEPPAEDWKISILDTGVDSLTGKRIALARKYIGEQPFLLTYGDGVSNVNIQKVIEEHVDSKKSLTMTAVRPEGRFGAIEFDSSGGLTSFNEKGQDDRGWINGGFFVCEPEVFDALDFEGNQAFEHEPIEKLLSQGQVHCFRHYGFWRCMDTLAEKRRLEELWETHSAQWKVWKD